MRPFGMDRSRRLHGRADFAAVYDAGMKLTRGPLRVYARTNGLEHGRLGISISRHVGIAVKRNRIKRLLREAFRLSQNELPAGYDWVVMVRPHEPMGLGEYRELLVGVMRKLAEICNPPSPPAPEAPGEG